MPDKDEIEQVVKALWDVYDIRNVGPDNTTIIRRIEGVVKILGASDTANGKYGGIRRTIADAMAKTYLIRTLTEIEKSSSARS